MIFKLEQPEWLWLLLLIPLLAVLLGRTNRISAMLFPSTHVARAFSKKKSQNPMRWLFRLRFLALALLILALTRPMIGHQHKEIQAKGIDIILALDVSSSMNALDFRLKGREVRRIEAVKAAVEQFTKDRPDDRIALLMFAAKPYLMSPLTLDHDFLLDRLYRIDTGIIEDGTAIGTALARSIRRLHHRDAESRVVILLTDGENNRGNITPVQAAQTAVPLGIKVYTIGAGTKGLAKVLVKDQFGREFVDRQEVRIDEETLEEIAELTGGRYFRATDLGELENVYKEIDQLEKSTQAIQGFTVDRELFPYFLAAALLIVLLEIILAQTLFLKIP